MNSIEHFTKDQTLGIHKVVLPREPKIQTIYLYTLNETKVIHIKPQMSLESLLLISKEFKQTLNPEVEYGEYYEEIEGIEYDGVVYEETYFVIGWDPCKPLLEVKIVTEKNVYSYDSNAKMFRNDRWDFTCPVFVKKKKL